MGHADQTPPGTERVASPRASLRGRPVGGPRGPSHGSGRRRPRSSHRWLLPVTGSRKGPHVREGLRGVTCLFIREPRVGVIGDASGQRFRPARAEAATPTPAPAHATFARGRRDGAVLPTSEGVCLPVAEDTAQGTSWASPGGGEFSRECHVSETSPDRHSKGSGRRRHLVSIPAAVSPSLPDFGYDGKRSDSVTARGHFPAGRPPHCCGPGGDPAAGPPTPPAHAGHSQVRGRARAPGSRTAGFSRIAETNG